MKKIIFSIVGSMLIGVCSLQAQQTDTEGTTSKSKSKQDKSRTEQSSHDKNKNRSADQSWQQQSDRSQTMGQTGHQYLVVVETKDVPSNIRQKLQSGDQYSGWEKATVYHNTQTGDYIIVPQPFAFDKQGNERQMSDVGQSLGYGAWQSGANGQQNNDAYSSGQRNQRSGQQNNDAYSSGQQNQRSGQQGNTSSQRSSEQQAQDQMGEIPTSAPEQSDNSGQSTGDQSSTHRTQDQSSTQQSSDTRQSSDAYRSSDRNQPGVTSQDQSDQASSSQYRTEDMVEVQTEQIPASLRRTLRESQYSGWEEKGTLYQDPSTSEYVLVMDKDQSSTAQTSSSSQPKAYRFDKNGQVKEDDNSTQSNRQ